MSDKRAPKPIEDLDARLQRLKAEVEAKKTPAGEAPRSGAGMAFEMSTHLVAGIVVGGGLGYLLDEWLGTAPVMLVVLFFMGAAAGMLNVYRTASGMGMALGYRPSSGDREVRRNAKPADTRGEQDETKNEGRGGEPPSSV